MYLYVIYAFILKIAAVDTACDLGKSWWVEYGGVVCYVPEVWSCKSKAPTI